MDFLNIKLFPKNLIDAIGNTLVHSLWQGVLLAAITGLIVVFTRKSSSVRRYNLLIAALVLFVAGVAVTFVVEFNSSPVADASIHQKNLVEFQHAILNGQFHYDQATNQPSLKETIMSFINKNANGIVLIWFVIVFARSLQLATGLNGLYYLRHKSVYPVDTLLERRVRELELKLDITQMVRIVESGIAKAPMVIGHLKPLILIPIGLITTLTAEEVEAILIHELAHVRRRDYLVNMLQSFMEIIFFFNPAVLWISALIKNERENCCDDIVVAQSSSKADYIKALVSCQEYNMTAPAYAVALTGNKNHLLTRVKRMLSNNNQSLNMMEKSLLAVCLISACLITTAFSNADKINTLVTKTAKVVAHITSGTDKKQSANKTEPERPVIVPNTENTLINKTDTPKDTKFKIYRSKEIFEHSSVSLQNGPLTSQLYKQDGILYQLNYKDNVFSSMEVNGKNIPDDHITSYQSIIDEIQAKNNMAAKQSDAIYMTGKNATASSAEIQKMLAEIVKEKGEAENKNKYNFDQFVAYGDDYRKNGQYQDALDFYKKAETINPASPELEKKMTDTQRLLNATPEEKRRKSAENAQADELAKNLEQANALIEQGDYYRSKNQYQDALNSYKKAEPISPAYLRVDRIIAYTQEQLNQYVKDSVSGAYRNGYTARAAYPAKPPRVAVTAKAAPVAPTAAYATPGVYPQNYAYTAAGKSELARKDSINRANIMNDMMKDGLIQTLDNLSFKISTEEFVVNGKKQPEDIYQKYRAKYVKVVGHGDWSWYYNYDTAQRKTTNTTVDNTNSKD